MQKLELGHLNRQISKLNATIQQVSPFNLPLSFFFVPHSSFLLSFLILSFSFSLSLTPPSFLNAFRYTTATTGQLNESSMKAQVEHLKQQQLKQQQHLSSLQGLLDTSQATCEKFKVLRFLGSLLCVHSYTHTHTHTRTHTHTHAHAVQVDGKRQRNTESGGNNS